MLALTRQRKGVCFCGGGATGDRHWERALFLEVVARHTYTIFYCQTLKVAISFLLLGDILLLS